MKKRLTATTFLIVLVALLVSNAMGVWFLFNQERDDSLESLKELLILMDSQSQITNAQAAAEQFRQAAPDKRLTIIDTDGTVLVDTDADADSLENHASRPEVASALACQEITRVLEGGLRPDMTDRSLRGLLESAFVTANAVIPRWAREDLSLAYTSAVAEPCRVIAKDYEQSFKLTRRSHLVAVITDGTAVLGLGDIGPAAGMPVMEGKCALFKEFADVDAFPICIDSKDTDTIVQGI